VVDVSPKAGNPALERRLRSGDGKRGGLRQSLLAPREATKRLDAASRNQHGAAMTHSQNLCGLSIIS
jgi:hypothetical protein